MNQNSRIRTLAFSLHPVKTVISFPSPQLSFIPLTLLLLKLRSYLLSFMALLSSSKDGALWSRETCPFIAEFQTKTVEGNTKNQDCSPPIKDIYLHFGQLSVLLPCLPLLRELRCPYHHLFFFTLIILYPSSCSPIGEKGEKDFGWENRVLCVRTKCFCLFTSFP